MSIGDSNVVDGADVNPPSADVGPDPCVSNHDVLPLVPVVPDVPVSTEAMMPRTAVVESWKSHSAVSTTGRGSAQSMYCQQSKENTRPNMAFHPFLFTNTPVTTPLILTNTPVTTPLIAHRSPHQSRSPAHRSPRRSRSRRGEHVRDRRGDRYAGE